MIIFRRESLFCAISIVILQIPAHADLIAYEPFDYADVAGDLFDKDGGGGFFAEWLQYDGAPILDNWRIAEGSLNYPGLQTEGNSVTSEVLFGDAWVGLLRELESDVDEGTRYLSFLMRPEGEIDEGAYGGAFGVVLAGVEGDGDLLIGKTDGSADYMLETFFNTATRFSNIPAESEITALVVVKAELEPGADTFTMFLNPTPGQPEPANGTIKRDLDLGTSIGISIAAAGAVSIDEIRWGDSFADVTPSSTLVGDFDSDGQLTLADIDLLCAEARAGTNRPQFDLNGDALANQTDRSVWVEQIKKTWFGDANLDGEFNSGDLVHVFQRGEYEDGLPGNSTWEDGDWDGDGEFSTTDFVIAFQGGGFEKGPRLANTVPEPSSRFFWLWAVGLVLLKRTDWLNDRHA